MPVTDKWKRIPARTVAKADRMRAKGMSWPQIGKVLGLPWQTVETASRRRERGETITTSLALRSLCPHCYTPDCAWHLTGDCPREGKRIPAQARDRLIARLAVEE